MRFEPATVLDYPTASASAPTIVPLVAPTLPPTTQPLPVYNEPAPIVPLNDPAPIAPIASPAVPTPAIIVPVLTHTPPPIAITPLATQSPPVPTYPHPIEYGPTPTIIPDRQYRLYQLAGYKVPPIKVIFSDTTVDGSTLPIYTAKSAAKKRTGFIGPLFDKDDPDLFVGVL